MNEKQNIEAAYRIAKERYAGLSVDTDQAIKLLQNLEISMHCWQGDDFHGFEGSSEGLSGRIMKRHLN